MNLTELKTAINRRTGIAVDDTALTEMVNEALQAIAEERPWPWLDAEDTFTTEASEAHYAMPANYAQTRTVTVNGHATNRINIGDLDANDSLDDFRGLWAYAIEGDDLVLDPTPSSGMTVIHRYRRTEKTLVSGSDEPYLPSQYHPAAINYASALIFDRAGDGPRAETFRSEYGRWLGRMVDAMQRSQQPTRVRVRPGAGW